VKQKIERRKNIKYFNVLLTTLFHAYGVIF